MANLPTQIENNSVNNNFQTKVPWKTQCRVINMYEHTQIHKHTHKQINQHTRMHLRMRRLSSSQVCLATHIMRTTHTHSVRSQHTPTRQRSIQSHTHTHTHAQTYTQIYTYTYTHIHGHTYIHTHMHAHIPCIHQEVDRFLSLLHPTLKIWCGPWNLVHTKFEMWYASVSSDLIEMIYSTILQLSQAAHATYYGLVGL